MGSPSKWPIRAQHHLFSSEKKDASYTVCERSFFEEMCLTSKASAASTRCRTFAANADEDHGKIDTATREPACAGYSIDERVQSIA